jgi:hypothetical protein
VVVALVAGLSLAACGQASGYGQLIGVRAVPSPSPQASAIDTTPLVDSLNTELDWVNKTAPITDENSQFAAEFSSLLTIKQSERLAALQQLGDQIISTRLSAIAHVRWQILVLPLATSQKYEIIYLLDHATAGLNGMEAKIANDRLVDVTRADVKSVAGFRVYGLLLPQAHMLVAAFDLQNLVGIYSNEKVHLQATINADIAANIPIGNAQSDVNDLGAQIVLINQASAYAIAVLPGLTPSGYPGNRGTVTAVRNTLNAGSGNSQIAAGDVAAAKVALGL